MQTSAAPKTPAQRVLELEQLVNRLDDQLRAEEAKAESLNKVLSRFRSFHGTSFGGIPMGQYWCDLMLWEAVMNSNPELTGVIEIGTWQGGFSTWLWANCMARKKRFITYDAVEPDQDVPNFTRMDVFAHPKEVEKVILLFGEPLIIFCDGGNKPRELKTFAPMLKDKRSMIAVHDWGTETLPTDVPFGLRMEYGPQCDDLGSVTRFFRASA